MKELKMWLELIGALILVWGYVAAEIALIIVAILFAVKGLAISTVISVVLFIIVRVLGRKVGEFGLEIREHLIKEGFIK